MDERLLLRNAQLVLPDADSRAPLPTGAVMVESGRIVAVLTRPGEIAALAAATLEVDLAGQVLIPVCTENAVQLQSEPPCLRGPYSMPKHIWLAGDSSGAVGRTVEAA